jgi:hypothetical protein
VKEVSEAKIEARGITYDERWAQREDRSERAKLGYIVAKKKREDEYKHSMELRGIP